MKIKTEIQRTKIIEKGDSIRQRKRGIKTKERDIKAVERKQHRKRRFYGQKQFCKILLW